MNATFKFTFTTRDEYLTQAKEWGLAYKQAILDVRAAKVGIKNANREGTDIYKAYRIKREADKAIEALQIARYESRREAHRQYTAAKELTAS